ncbi:hypothetical protein [Paraclostridium sordellii]|uniref:hypothetical protein n=1 Tax=Paraclostridium sordellii TaxID=1505 RepID=UPI00038596B9|nr:hypothetical protein [Paeniclostridium sordellii]EPZ56140.1 hypothetical protein H476_2742 [[Clostridium] sordellii VPI 9048] [Paeniclostridium sordellii VPI 9048]CEK38123.1 hypothetical protein JGS6382_14551 [[Clostridium] sordellii] [Paeniclostridium sordellii]
MKIINLRNSIKEKLYINYVDVKEQDRYYLSDSSPANIFDGNMNILNSLSESDKIEAEAHELCHILLKERGLICLSTTDGDLNFFVLELNNAISHKELVNTLQNELHYRLRYDSIKDIDKFIDDIKYFVENEEIYLLYGLGFRLYDIYTTLLESSDEEIESLVEENQHIKISFNLAKKYLSKIDSTTSKDNQIDIINTMLRELNVSTDKIKVK